MDPRMTLTASDAPRLPTGQPMKRARAVLRREDGDIDKLVATIAREALECLAGNPAPGQAFYVYSEALRRAADFLDENAPKG